MSKPNLLLSFTDYSNFDWPWIMPILKETFDVKYIEHTDKHSPHDSFVVVNYMNVAEEWCQQLINNGYKLVIEHLWDNDVYTGSHVDDGVLTLKNQNWCRYNESLWYRHLRYHEYKPNKNIEHQFLMMMNLVKPHRDAIFEKLSHHLDKSLYSYSKRGIQIAGDKDFNSFPSSINWERYMNPWWYDSTRFSIAVETMIDSPTFVSEKLFKPIAFYHPFLVWGSVGTLKYLKSEGFETMDHIIDESYDDIVDSDSRLSAIACVVNDIINNPIVFNDRITEQKLKHNNNLFFDQQKVVKRINDEIVGDILNFIE
jgi:hypothetical protein